MSDDDEDQPEEILGKRGKKDRKNKPLPKTPDEIEALIRRQKRNLRKAWAEGYLTAITAMLKPGDLAVDCGANMGVVTQRLAATGADVVAFEPDPFAFKTLEQKFAKLPNVTLINAAVGVGSGTGIDAGIGIGDGAGIGTEAGTGFGTGVGTGVGTGAGIGIGTGIDGGNGDGDGLGVGTGIGAVIDTRTGTKDGTGLGTGDGTGIGFAGFCVKVGMHGLFVEGDVWRWSWWSGFLVGEGTGVGTGTGAGTAAGIGTGAGTVLGTGEGTSTGTGDGIGIGTGAGTDIGDGIDGAAGVGDG